MQVEFEDFESDVQGMTVLDDIDLLIDVMDSLVLECELRGQIESALDSYFRRVGGPSAVRIDDDFKPPCLRRDGRNVTATIARPAMLLKRGVGTVPAMAASRATLATPVTPAVTEIPATAASIVTLATPVARTKSESLLKQPNCMVHATSGSTIAQVKMRSFDAPSAPIMPWSTWMTTVLWRC